MAGLNEVAKHSGVKADQVSAVFTSIITMCKAGEDVRINGVGTFKKVHKEERQGRNPSTNEPMTIPAKDVFQFKAASTVDMSIPKPAGRRR